MRNYRRGTGTQKQRERDKAWRTEAKRKALIEEIREVVASVR